MRTIFRVSAALALLAGPARAQTVVTFENSTLSQPLAGPDGYQNGRTLSPPGSFTASGAAFNNDYNPMYDSWSGWSYSNVKNLTTPGYGNQYAAYNVPGGGAGAAGSANYAVANNFSPGDATVALPAGTRPDSLQVTNTTYAALSIQTGDQFAKKFGGATGSDPDYFRLTIIGRNAQNQPTGSVDFYLADYRFADNSKDYLVSQWTTVDLTPLGADTAALSFELNSSDVGAFGMNTPAYFAVDNLALSPVPEPASSALLAAVGAAVWGVRRRRACRAGVGQ